MLEGGQERDGGARASAPGDRVWARRRPLRVLRIITRLNVGGPARHVAFLQEDLEAYGVEQTVACGRLGPGEGDLSEPVVRAGGALVRVPGLGRRISPLDDLRAFWRLVSLCRQLRPDLVHTHTAKAGALGRAAAWVAGVPLRVHTFHGHVLEGYFGPWGDQAVRGVERALSSITDRIIALSPRQAADLTGRFRVAPAAKVRVVPLGIDRRPFAEGAAPRGALRRELGLGPAVPLVGWVGRLVPIKAPALAVEAFATLAGGEPEPAPHLVMAGDGPLRAEVEAAAAGQGVAGRVHLLGNRTDMPGVLADLDLLLLSSRNEGTPLALIEGMAAGLPAVATAVGGVSDLAPGLDVIRLVPPGDAQALGAALGEALRDRGWRRQASGRAREAARRFDRARLAADVAAIYAELLAGRPALRAARR